jgi:hypothetical protein
MKTKTAGGNSCALCWYRWTTDDKKGHCYMFEHEPLPECMKLKVVSNFLGNLYEILDGRKTRPFVPETEAKP